MTSGEKKKVVGHICLLIIQNKNNFGKKNEYSPTSGLFLFKKEISYEKMALCCT